VLDWLGSVQIRERTPSRVELDLTRATAWTGWAIAVGGLRLITLGPVWAALGGMLVLGCGLLLGTLRRTLVFDREDGHLYACCPQLKKPKDVQRLWKGLKTGEVSVVSTDTCTFDREQKAMWKGDWTKIPMGLPGLETLLPLVYTRGVLGGRLTLEELSMKLSTNPARIMGLYPRKGAIAVGADADLAIIHPTATRPVTPSAMETNADWSPYEGWELAGFARTTQSTKTPGILTCLGLREPRSAIRSTCAITRPPELRAAIAIASTSSVSASFSIVMLPSGSAVVPRTMPTSIGKVR